MIQVREARPGEVDDRHRFVQAECDKNILRHACDFSGVVSMGFTNLQSCGGGIEDGLDTSFEPSYSISSLLNGIPCALAPP